jgi:hypothetical protein
VITLVFCEVKCRSGLGFGHRLEAITLRRCGPCGNSPLCDAPASLQGINHQAGRHRCGADVRPAGVPHPHTGGGLSGIGPRVVGTGGPR